MTKQHVYITNWHSIMELVEQVLLEKYFVIAFKLPTYFHLISQSNLGVKLFSVSI